MCIMLDLLSCHVLLCIYYMIMKLVMANFYKKYVYTYIRAVEKYRSCRQDRYILAMTDKSSLTAGHIDR